MKTESKISARSGLLRLGGTFVLVAGLAACSPFGFFSSSVEIEEIVPVEELYASATDNIERNRLNTAIEDLEKLERQHPYSDYAERGKVLLTFANFRARRYPETVLAADRFLALYPRSSEAPYVLFLKGSAYYQQITDITRDQELADDAIDTFSLLQSSYPDSRYAAESREMVTIARDQIAGKEMSVGRYYLGDGQYTAAINRFRQVVENHETTSHVEEALYRLVESYLKLGLVGEAQTAGAVLGHNYPTSEWYERAFQLLREQQLSPQMVAGNWLNNQV